MPATITFKVENISDAGANVYVNFQIATQVAGSQPGPSANVTLTFPAAEGREFEVDDTYSLQIAPKPEPDH